MVVKTILGFYLFTMPVYTLDLGSFGKTYPIREFPADKLIENKINSVNKDERIRLENQFLEITKSKISRPTAIQLPVVKKNNSRLFNPAVYFKDSVKDHQQKEVIKAGQHVNPLDFVSLTTPLVFFDSDDSIQKEWVKNHYKHAILILVKGEPLKVQDEFQKKVYFDQHGKFITRFSLKAVPSVITQDGKFLRIQECVPS